MKVLFDDDFGRGLPRALWLVGCNASYLYRLGLSGRPDVEWLAKAGQHGRLVFSCNKKMLKVPIERETIIREKVGIIFLTNGQEYSRKVLRLLLAKWDKLEVLWNTTQRPFARFLFPNGRLAEKYRDYQLFATPPH